MTARANWTQDHSGALIRPATDAAIREAAAYLRTGHLVAIPTETVYGLAADATNSLAVARIFEAKGRPRFNPLIVHVADISEAKKLGHFSEKALRLARAFWPGPLTLVVPRLGNCPVSELASAGFAEPRDACAGACRSRNPCSPSRSARSPRRRPIAQAASVPRPPRTSPKIWRRASP